MYRPVTDTTAFDTESNASTHRNMSPVGVFCYN